MKSLWLYLKWIKSSSLLISKFSEFSLLKDEITDLEETNISMGMRTMHIMLIVKLLCRNNCFSLIISQFYLNMMVKFISL